MKSCRVLCAVLAGANCWVEIAKFVEESISCVGFVPSRMEHPVMISWVMCVLDAQFQNCFISWVSSITGCCDDVVAVDGKTLRARPVAREPFTCICLQRPALVLGQKKVTDKSNEITAIPKLLDLLTLNGAIGMGCQRAIAAGFSKKRPIRSGTERQSGLHDDVALYVEEQSACAET